MKHTTALTKDLLELVEQHLVLIEPLNENTAASSSKSGRAATRT
jgi:hypothetical protein